MSDTVSLIGKILEEPHERDAIHVAVAPVIAGQQLEPGDWVKLESGFAVFVPPKKKKEAIGIVDPFLRTSVARGLRFWLFLPPGSITSLHHNWTHPGFVEEKETDSDDGLAAFLGVSTVRESKLWLRNYARKLGVDYDELMEATGNFLRNGEPYSDGDGLEGVSPSKEFWHHYQVVTNCHLMEEDKQDFFTCAC